MLHQQLRQACLGRVREPPLPPGGGVPPPQKASEGGGKPGRTANPQLKSMAHVSHAGKRLTSRAALAPRGLLFPLILSAPRGAEKQRLLLPETTAGHEGAG